MVDKNPSTSQVIISSIKYLLDANHTALMCHSVGRISIAIVTQAHGEKCEGMGLGMFVCLYVCMSISVCLFVCQCA